jgi:hypothetical protein
MEEDRMHNKSFTQELERTKDGEDPGKGGKMK